MITFWELLSLLNQSHFAELLDCFWSCANTNFCTINILKSTFLGITFIRCFKLQGIKKLKKYLFSISLITTTKVPNDDKYEILLK